MHTREAAIGAPDSDGRIPVTISTEHPVDRGRYIEVLSHVDGDIDLSRAPLPLIESHDQQRLPIGIVEGLRVLGRTIKGFAKFSSSPRAQSVLRDIRDGIIRHVSIGYEYLDDGVPAANGTIRSKFRPLEVSAVAVPADPAAGFYRNYPRNNDMETSQDQTTDSSNLPAAASRSQRRAADASMNAERERVTEIMAIGEQFKSQGLDKLALDAIHSGESLQQFRVRAMAQMSSAPLPLHDLSSTVDFERRDQERYSIARALNAVLTQNWTKAGLERAASEECARRSGRTSLEPTSVLVPLNAFRAPTMRRDLITSTGSAGGFLVATDLRGDLLIDLLRPYAVVANLPVVTLPGLVGNVTVPKVSAGSTAYWLATETTSITESQPTLGQVALTPKTVGAYNEVSRQLLLQSSPNAEAVIQGDLLKTIGAAVDVAAINGSGASGQPQGVIGASGVGSVTGTSIDYAKVLEFQSDVATANALALSCGYVTTPAVASLLSQRQRFTSTDSPLWSGNLMEGQVAGFRALASTAVPAATMIFGDWSQMMIGQWGAIELATNPYANFQAGIVGVRVFASLDVAVRNGAAFSVATSIT